jgi:hypothetical protein
MMQSFLGVFSLFPSRLPEKTSLEQEEAEEEIQRKN